MKARLFALCLVLSLTANSGLGRTPISHPSELIIGQNAEAVTLDPAQATDSESAKIISNIFEGLVRYKDDSTEIEPALAETWQTSQDGKEWIFHLRKGVLFHDGTRFNAEAVVFSFLRQIDSQHPFHQKFSSYANFAFQYVQSVQAMDEYTVRIRLDKPYAPFLCNMAMSFATPIVSPTAVRKWRDTFEKHPAGTGAFQFVEWIPNDRIVLAPNPNYWGGSPLVEKVIFRPFINPSVRFKEFQSGRIHVIDGIAPGDLRKTEQLPQTTLVRLAGLNVAYVAMNTEKKPFDQVKVRQAINHAFNKKKVIKLLYQDMAIPAKNPIPPTIWGYNDEAADYEYNPERARELLKEAGYENGFETTLWTMSVSRPYMPQPMKIALAIKENLSIVGIRVKIVSEDWKTYIAKTENGEHDMCLAGWNSDNGDPDNFVYTLLDRDNTVKPKAQNLAFFKHDELHELLTKAQQLPDKQDRTKLYRQAQEIIHQQAPWVPLAHVQRVLAFRNNVHGIVCHPTAVIRLNRVWME